MMLNWRVVILAFFISSGTSIPFARQNRNEARQLQMNHQNPIQNVIAYDILYNITEELRIAGGTPASIKDYPYQVSITLGEALCGGSILNEKYILTAAHCIGTASTTDISVRAGSDKWDSGGVVKSIEKVYQHPQFDAASYDYDVAVIQLETNLAFDETINSISLPPADYIIEDNVLATVTGFGYVSPTGPLSESLQVVELPLISTEECQKIYGEDQISDRMFCAGYVEGVKDACQGDSGGPLVVDKQVVGIVSFGPDCGNAGAPGAYTKVSAMREFIDPIIQAS